MPGNMLSLTDIVKGIARRVRCEIAATLSPTVDRVVVLLAAETAGETPVDEAGPQPYTPGYPVNKLTLVGF